MMRFLSSNYFYLGYLLIFLIFTGYKWVHCHNIGCAPSGAVVGGNDSDGHTIYVARSHYSGDWLPAKFMPSKRAAYVCYSGREHSVHSIEVLVQSTLTWVHSSNGHVPAGAVSAGSTRNGEMLYVGRACHRGSCTIGKVWLECNIYTYK